MYIADSLTLNSESTILKVRPEWSLLNTHIFSISHILSCLILLRNKIQHFGTVIRDNLSSKITKQKPPNAKKTSHHLNRERTLVYSMRAATRREGRASVFDLSWEWVCRATQIFATLHVSVVSTKLILELQINTTKETNSQIWNSQVMRIHWTWNGG